MNIEVENQNDYTLTNAQQEKIRKMIAKSTNKAINKGVKKSKKLAKKAFRKTKKTLKKAKKKLQKTLAKKRKEFKKAQAAKAKRTASAKKGWETRRKNEEAKKARSEAAKKGWETRRAKQAQSVQGNVYTTSASTTDTTAAVEEATYDYDYFKQFPDSEDDAGDGYPYIYHLFVLDDDAPGDWDHMFTEDEIFKGKGSGFAWAAQKI